MDDVFIVEAAFTGIGGFPRERTVEVAVCRMHADGMDYDTIYQSFVFADPMDIGKDALDYLEENYGITSEVLYAAPDEETVSKELMSKLRETECTSFNVNRTFGQFLCFEPWDFTRELTLLPSISSRLSSDMASDVTVAYEHLFPDNPAGIAGKTAMDRCVMSTEIMMRLRQAGLF